jgi:hemoglobin-like flavoprotein
MDASFDQVIGSYHRARDSGKLFDTFYDLFLRKSPEIPPMFARTDFPHQKMMLRESILVLLTFAQTGSGREEVERLAGQHRELKVNPAHYDLWLDALCEALAKHDPKFNAQLEAMWREALRKGLERMSAAPA